MGLNDKTLVSSATFDYILKLSCGLICRYIVLYFCNQKATSPADYYESTWVRITTNKRSSRQPISISRGRLVSRIQGSFCIHWWSILFIFIVSWNSNLSVIYPGAGHGNPTCVQFAQPISVLHVEKIPHFCADFCLKRASISKKTLIHVSRVTKYHPFPINH